MEELDITVWSSRVATIITRIHISLNGLLPKKSSSQLDLSATLRSISLEWSTLIANKNIKVGRKVIKECITARNEYAHQSLRTVGDHRRVLKSFKKLAGLVELKALENEIDCMLEVCQDQGNVCTYINIYFSLI